jgi:hypothetical protein
MLRLIIYAYLTTIFGPEVAIYVAFVRLSLMVVTHT